MAALVGLLRQLGDLAEFAAEIFHNLHEEVMVTAARGHSLMGRVQQLEAEVPSLEKAFYSQTHHSSFFTNGGIGWHPNLQSEQNLVTHGDLPRFIMDSYEDSRGPPRLFLLDKFDVAGAGACLKRYTDPSFFKMESASSGIATVEVHREKRIRKVKKKGARLRDTEAPIVASHSKLHQLLLEDRIENGYTNPARLVKLKKRQLNGSSAETNAGKSYMEKLLETTALDHKLICETSIIPLPAKLMSDDGSEAGVRILEISSISPVKKSFGNHKSPNEEKLELKPFSEVNGGTYGDLMEANEQVSAGVTDKLSSSHPELLGERELTVIEQKKMEGSIDGYHSDDATSEVDNYMDALTTMESELETDNEWKPKKGFLNMQKVTDTDGKEEHQLQAQLSDSQSFGDSSAYNDIGSFKEDRSGERVQTRLSNSHSTGTSSTSDSISSFRRDGNEHIELQAHFSDSQSVGNSSVSDENNSFKNDKSCFTDGDSLSTVVENIQSEPFSYAKHYEPEVVDAPSNQIRQMVEFRNMDCGKFDMHDDANAKEEISDSGKASSDGLCSASPVTLPTGTRSDETPCNLVELNLRLEDTEDRTGLIESIAEPASLSLVKDDSCHVDSSDKKSPENMGNDDPYVHSDDLLRVSNDLDSACEDECSDHSEIRMLQAYSPNENYSEILVSRDVVSKGKDHIFPSMEELNLNSGTMPVLDSQDSKDENCNIGAQLNLEGLSPLLPTSCFIGEASSDLILDSPHDEPSSAEIEVLNSDLRSNFEEVSKMVHGDEIRSTCSVDPVEGDGCFKNPSSHNNLEMVNDVVTQNTQSEDQAMLNIPSVDSVENDAGIVPCPDSGLMCFPSRSLSDLQQPLPGSSDSCKMEIESNEVELAQISMDPNKEEGENQLEPSKEMITSDAICSPMRSLTKLEESPSTFADPHEKEMEVSEAIGRQSLTELEEQKVVGKPELAYAGDQLKLNQLVPCDLSDSERCNNVQNSSSEQFQHGAFVDDVKMSPELSGLYNQQSKSIFDGQNDFLQNGQDSYSSSCDQVESETNLEMFIQSQVGDRDTEFMAGDEENFASDKSQSQQMQIYQSEQESTHDTSELASEIYADEPSSSNTSGQEIIPTKHVVDPLKPSLLDPFPAAENNLDDMPPLPPLPPMQWRTGKVQHASLFPQREEAEVNRALVQPMQPIKPDTQSQSGFPTSERDGLLLQSPFLPFMAMESDRLQYSSGFSMGVSGNPAAIPFQYPVMVNDANGQYNYVVLDRNQIQNSFLTFPVASSVRPTHGYIAASEGEMVQNSNLCSPILPAESAVYGLDSICVPECLGQPPSQVRTETSSEVKTLQQSTCNVVATGRPPCDYNGAFEGEMVQSSNSYLPIPPECIVSGHDSISPQEKPTQSPSQLMMETSLEVKTLEQSISNMVSMGGDPHDYPVASQGQMAQNSNPLPLVAPTECAVSGDDSISLQDNTTQSPSQIMTETSLEVKTLHQPVSNAEGEQRHPYISLMSPPNMESMELGEIGSSSDMYAQTSDFESERTNVKPKNKLPRPRNPLIDAVVAHDKSKLRRVTDRVMPEVAQKVEERDSLLEQIRTKSFNLKPAVATRPSIQGPRTNLKLAAILEKANAIRQALAGSDEDDDADSWSDS
ncbi:hypothetical protein RIF29_25763 [Crotalaria pallida]|uniref:Protein SCAR n=1 Tax=Crotalaria pallida TaxID=3830 RepID=A0AAN9EPE3_CROPI